MACLEHYCTNNHCDYFDMDNNVGPDNCPRCNSRVYHLFDEVADVEVETECEGE